MMMEQRMSPMNPLELKTSEEATVKPMTINKGSSSGGNLISFFMSFKFLFPLLAMLVFCVLLCVFVFQILNKGKWEVLAMISWNKKQKRTPGGIISITYAIFTA